MQFYMEDKCNQQMQTKSASEKIQEVLCFSEAD